MDTKITVGLLATALECRLALIELFLPLIRTRNDYWSEQNILLVRVALGKGPILIGLLVKQTEFALMRPPPPLKAQIG